MTRTIRTAGVLALLCVVAVVAPGCSYNQFVAQEEGIRAQWAQVENQLQRRNDLIPNLVETTKGVAQQERDVFQAVADARAKMAGATTPAQRIEAANAESSALARLLVVVENYPQLKSNETFARLMDELSGTENRLATERLRYNERIQEYNTLRRRFPSNVTATLFGFQEYPYFNAPTTAEAAPKEKKVKRAAKPATAKTASKAKTAKRAKSAKAAATAAEKPKKKAAKRSAAKAAKKAAKKPAASKAKKPARRDTRKGGK